MSELNPLTNREWGLLMRLLMNCENSIRNNIRAGAWDGWDVWDRQQRERADAIRKMRAKLKIRRKAEQS